MKLKMIDIINFNVFYDEIRTKKLPLKVLFNLSKLATSVETNLKFYQEKFQSILDEYGEKDDNGNLVPTENGRGVKVRPGTEPACVKEITELQNLEIELPDIKFDIEEFGDIELSLEIFQIIAPFIN